MKKDGLKNNLKRLEQITPDFNWKITNRELLLSEISKDALANSKEKVEAKDTLFKDLLVFFPKTTLKLVARPVFTVILAVSLILGTGVATVGAARGSLPGDTLYPVKRTFEKARISLMFSQDKKARLGIKLAKNRLNELGKITQKSEASAEKVQKINIVVEDLKKDIKTVKNRLEKVENENLSEKTVDLAKVIDTETEELKKGLKEQKEQMSAEIKKETEEKMAEAITSVEETGIKALSIIIEKHATGEVEISEDEVAERINNKIESTKEKMIELGTSLNEEQAEEPSDSADDSSEESQPDQLDDADVSDGSESGDQNKETELIDENEEVKDNDQKAQQTLLEAENLLENKDFSTALSKITESNELLDEAAAEEEDGTVQNEDEIVDEQDDGQESGDIGQEVNQEEGVHDGGSSGDDTEGEDNL